jgi:uncharacterized protein YecE (DUF72 family)
VARKRQEREAAGAPATRGRILIGPAGWSYSDWNGIVYPAHHPAGFHEAEYLAQFFDTIEINTSFYNPLRPEMCRQWLARVGANPGFLFTAKLWQRFTHEGGASAADVAAARAGFEVLHAAGRLGAVLLQFPFSFHNTPDNRAHLEKLLSLFREYPLVVEVRHSTWNQKEFYEFLHGRGAGFCNIDQPVIGRSLRPSDRATSPVGYIRLHGRRYDTWFSDDPASPPEERYNYLYSAEELDPWAARIEKVAGHSKTTFVITNNHYQGKAIVNALQLINLLTGKKVKVPETLRPHYPQLEPIASEPAREPTLFPLGTSPAPSRE